MNINLNRIYAWPLSFRLLLMLCVAVLVFIALFIFDISSLNNQLKQSQQKEQELKDQLAAIITSQANQQNQLIQYKNVGHLLTEWQKKLITYESLPDFMDQILKIGTINHIDFNLFSPASPIKDKDSIYTKVPIKIIALGTYDNLSNLVSQIAALPTIAVIGNFSITNEIKPETLDPKLAARAVAEQLVMLDMTLEVYYLANKKEQK